MYLLDLPNEREKINDRQSRRHGDTETEGWIPGYFENRPATADVGPGLAPA
jgi:hypothetical protein